MDMTMKGSTRQAPVAQSVFSSPGTASSPPTSSPTSSSAECWREYTRDSPRESVPVDILRDCPPLLACPAGFAHSWPRATGEKEDPNVPLPYVVCKLVLP
mmetsp:Transcript_5027/g.14055  ORF Transcript_5027/g.14055 Transcript_5027/m.14055 type:complete len:100 (+) Transcript_5027:182-481(+)